jgi:hypothetical protein
MCTVQVGSRSMVASARQTRARVSLACRFKDVEFRPHSKLTQNTQASSSLPPPQEAPSASASSKSTTSVINTKRRQVSVVVVGKLNEQAIVPFPLCKGVSIHQMKELAYEAEQQAASMLESGSSLKDVVTVVKRIRERLYRPNVTVNVHHLERQKRFVLKVTKQAGIYFSYTYGRTAEMARSYVYRAMAEALCVIKGGGPRLAERAFCHARSLQRCLEAAAPKEPETRAKVAIEAAGRCRVIIGDCHNSKDHFSSQSFPFGLQKGVDGLLTPSLFFVGGKRHRDRVLTSIKLSLGPLLKVVVVPNLNCMGIHGCTHDEMSSVLSSFTEMAKQGCTPPSWAPNVALDNEAYYKADKGFRVPSVELSTALSKLSSESLSKVLRNTIGSSSLVTAARTTRFRDAALRLRDREGAVEYSKSPRPRRPRSVTLRQVRAARAAAAQPPLHSAACAEDEFEDMDWSLRDDAAEARVAESSSNCADLIRSHHKAQQVCLM